MEGHARARAAALWPGHDGDVPTDATKLAMRTLGRRVLAAQADIRTIDARLAELVVATAPSMLEFYDVDVDTAADLLVAAGNDPATWLRP